VAKKKLRSFNSILQQHVLKTQTFVDSLLEKKFDSFNSTLPVRSNRYQTQTFLDRLLEEKVQHLQEHTTQQQVPDPDLLR
jgi:hypothetical protein